MTPAGAEGAPGEPTPELDDRFSDPDTTATPWPTTRDVLQSAQMFWLTTVRRDGRPHVTPLVAVWHDDALHFCTGPAEQKAVNLAANPQVVLATGCNTWEAGLDVIVEGEARTVTDRGALEQLAAAWRQKWDGRWEFTAAEGGFSQEGGGVAPVFVVVARKILAFSKNPFTHTRYAVKRTVT